MKTVTLTELRLHTGEILAEVASGRAVTILRRGVPIAELHPIVRRAGRPMPDRGKWLATFPRVKGDSGRFLETDRR